MIKSLFLCIYLNKVLALVDVLKPSVITCHTILGKSIYVKRDDQLNFKNLSGNKARKLFHLASMENFPKYVISYGGIQSNSMLAISQIVSYRGHNKFIYFTKPIPEFIRKVPSGNYANAVELGMNIIELDNNSYDLIESPSEYKKILDLYNIPLEDTYFLPQGGANQDASIGIKYLAEEIYNFILENKGNWKILVCSGTGTTSLFLSKWIHELSKTNKNLSIEVIALPCVGSDEYLYESMKALVGEQKYFPKILKTFNNRIFAKPYREHLDIWSDICSSSGIEFDLIYAPRAWELLKNSFKLEPDIWKDVNILYYHCGGVSPGNISQLARYKYKNMIS